jgi:hypothetical protein
VNTILRLMATLIAIMATWYCFLGMHTTVIELMLFAIYTYLGSDPWKKGGAA